MSKQERDLVGLFVRDIDRTELPPRSAWRPAVRPRRALPTALRSLVIATSAIALVAAAALAGVALRETRQAASSPSPSATAPAGAASPSPSASQAAPSPTTAPSRTPTPEPTRSGVLDERFGFIYYPRVEPPANQRTSIRSETNATPIGTFAWGGHAVSPDGRFVAYWTAAPRDQTLHVVAAGGGDPTPALITLSGRMFGGTIAWSSDGRALAVAFDNRDFGLPTSDPDAELWTVDLATRATERIAKRTDGQQWVPIAWDRMRQVIAAVMTGEGGYAGSYELIDHSSRPVRTRSTTFQGTPVLHFHVFASSDARYAAANVFREDGPVLWWPLSAPDDRRTIDGSWAAWRPGTSELWYVDPRGDVAVVDVASGARRTALQGIGAIADVRSGLHFRTDGSALIVRPKGTEDLLYIDIASGEREAVKLGTPGGIPVRLR